MTLRKMRISDDVQITFMCIYVKLGLGIFSLFTFTKFLNGKEKIQDWEKKLYFG